MVPSKNWSKGAENFFKGVLAFGFLLWLWQALSLNGHVWKSTFAEVVAVQNVSIHLKTPEMASEMPPLEKVVYIHLQSRDGNFRHAAQKEIILNLRENVNLARKLWLMKNPSWEVKLVPYGRSEQAGKGLHVASTVFCLDAIEDWLSVDVLKSNWIAESPEQLSDRNSKKYEFVKSTPEGPKIMAFDALSPKLAEHMSEVHVLRALSPSRLRWICELGTDSPENCKREMKPFLGQKQMRVVNLGLPKTGTTSLRSMLKTIGYESNHWSCSVLLKYNLPFHNWAQGFRDRYCFSRTVCGGLVEFALQHPGLQPFDLIVGNALTQMDCMSKNTFVMPQRTHLNEIVGSYQKDEIVFVLTTRTSRSWLRSVSSWNDMKIRFNRMIASEEDEALIQFKESHEEDVRQACRSAGMSLIELNIDGDRDELVHNFTKLQVDFLKVPEAFVLHQYAWTNRKASTVGNTTD